MEAHGKSCLRKSENRCRVTRSQALPGDKQERFLVTLG